MVQKILWFNKFCFDKFGFDKCDSSRYMHDRRKKDQHCSHTEVHVIDFHASKTVACPGGGGGCFCCFCFSVVFGLAFSSWKNMDFSLFREREEEGVDRGVMVPASYPDSEFSGIVIVGF